jgi:hypothetical protein
MTTATPTRHHCLVCLTPTALGHTRACRRNPRNTVLARIAEMERIEANFSREFNDDRDYDLDELFYSAWEDASSRLRKLYLERDSYAAETVYLIA